MKRIKLIIDSIQFLDVDAIVNAANKELQEGGGVCGAIFKAADAYKLQEACDEIGPIKTGEAVITPGFDLRAKYVIHTAGPIYRNKTSNLYLQKAYENTLKVAEANNIKTIAIPSISTGIYHFPPEDASKIAVNTIINYFKENPESCIEQVVLCCYQNETFKLYENYLNDLKIDFEK